MSKYTLRCSPNTLFSLDLRVQQLSMKNSSRFFPCRLNLSLSVQSTSSMLAKDSDLDNFQVNTSPSPFSTQRSPEYCFTNQTNVGHTSESMVQTCPSRAHGNLGSFELLPSVQPIALSEEHTPFPSHFGQMFLTK